MFVLLVGAGECMWLHLDLIREVQSSCKKLFPRVEYATTSMPTYPCGSMGFVLCSLDAAAALTEPRADRLADLSRMRLRYYNAGLHKAAFMLPTFVRDALEKR